MGYNRLQCARGGWCHSQTQKLSLAPPKRTKTYQNRPTTLTHTPPSHTLCAAFRALNALSDPVPTHQLVKRHHQASPSIAHARSHGHTAEQGQGGGKTCSLNGFYISSPLKMVLLGPRKSELSKTRAKTTCNARYIGLVNHPRCIGGEIWRPRAVAPQIL